MLLERERSAAATGDGSRFCDRREAISLALLAVLIGYFPVDFGGKKGFVGLKVKMPPCPFSAAAVNFLSP